MLTESIGFIGAGQMATALGQGLVRAGLVAAKGLLAADPLPEARERFTAATGGRATMQNAEVVAESDVVILAVKPQQMERVMAGLRGLLAGRHLVISIAAGIRLAALAEGLGGEVRLIRAMPNTPCLVGRGASAYSLGPRATAADVRVAEELLRAVGIALPVEEKLLDAVTGLSGCGPAFVYVVIEALADGGVKAGLPREVAAALAAQTVLGAGQMVLSSGEHPSVLKDRVASPGGATIAGLQAIEEGGLRATLMAAVEAAARRSMELGAS
ncbi:MAG: pyrroline-5-carboxylate reductase [Thermoguttaceae bacterium]